MKLEIIEGENPAKLKLELFCQGLKIETRILENKEYREIIRTRGGLGSGIELILPKHLWVNAPLYEKFVDSSPFKLIEVDGRFWITRENKRTVEVALAPKANFYSLKTKSGNPMSQIGTLQGGYLAFFPTSSCEFWPKDVNCQFCSTGLNLGTTEQSLKSVEDVVEVAIQAFDEGLASFIHVNIGYYPTPDRGILQLAPYIKALKEETDAIIICQSTPPETNEWADYAYSIGVDSMSSNFELYNPDYFRKFCPGKAKYIGQQRFFDWLEYLPDVFPGGGGAGEIIVGLEPLEDSLKAIEYITSVGALPIVCAFRPLIGTKLENHPPPTYTQMEQTLKHAYINCKRNNVKMNAVDRVSIVMMAQEARLLFEGHEDNFLQKIMQGITRTSFGKKIFKRLVLDKKRKKFNASFVTPESISQELNKLPHDFKNDEKTQRSLING